MDKILITGASGLLGSSLVPHMRSLNYNVITHAFTNSGDYIFDLSNSIVSFKYLENISPNIIINLVGATSVEHCEDHIGHAYLTNVKTVENIVNWIQIKKSDVYLIHISTDHVYDGDSYSKEESIVIKNNYAMTKYAGELVAAKVPCTILRTNFVGRSKLPFRDSLTDWVYNAIKLRKKEDVLSDVYFNPISISLLAEIITLVVQKKVNGVFNVGTHKGMSKADFDFAFAKALGSEGEIFTPIKLVEATFFRAVRPKNMLMDVSKFEKVFGKTLPILQNVIEQIAEEYNDII